MYGNYTPVRNYLPITVVSTLSFYHCLCSACTIMWYLESMDSMRVSVQLAGGCKSQTCSALNYMWIPWAPDTLSHIQCPHLRDGGYLCHFTLATASFKELASQALSRRRAQKLANLTAELDISLETANGWLYVQYLVSSAVQFPESLLAPHPLLPEDFTVCQGWVWTHCTEPPQSTGTWKAEQKLYLLSRYKSVQLFRVQVNITLPQQCALVQD